MAQTSRRRYTTTTYNKCRLSCTSLAYEWFLLCLHLMDSLCDIYIYRYVYICIYPQFWNLLQGVGFCLLIVVDCLNKWCRDRDRDRDTCVVLYHKMALWPTCFVNCMRTSKPVSHRNRPASHGHAQGHGHRLLSYLIFDFQSISLYTHKLCAASFPEMLTIY